MQLLQKEEKKVEYLELIYDLIFVYMVGRNNALIHNIENGFVEPLSFLSYVICTLAILQIWNFTTFYINLFGRNSVRDHVFLFINMYLLYFVGQSTRTDWQDFQTQYHIAWGLILLNIGAQYLIELRNHPDEPQTRGIIKGMIGTLAAEAALVFIAAIPNPLLGTIFSVTAILCGIVLTFFCRDRRTSTQIDFGHLTERAMLYVVFTFGEMIIALAAYFTGDGSFDLTTVYFSLMAFLIVVGLFLSYGLIYDHLIDREGQYSGMTYMLVHIFIIFFMNNITASLEFMREEEIDNLPKMLFLIISVIGYFVFLFALRGYIKSCDRPSGRFTLLMGGLTTGFVVLMLLFREQMTVNILLTVIYVASMFLLLLRAKKITKDIATRSAE